MDGNLSLELRANLTLIYYIFMPITNWVLLGNANTNDSNNHRIGQEV